MFLCVELLSNGSYLDGVTSDIILNMSGTSRKVKNPLLSAAGPGFPFENYTENALLVPVTPATNAVQDGEYVKMTEKFWVDFSWPSVNLV